jgi:hypothetical protein
MMERVGDAVRRELGRFGPTAAMSPLAEAWPAAVGELISRNAWPARLARDGTLHVHTTDSIWAFELKSRAAEIQARLGEHAPAHLSFAPGPIPEPVEPAVREHITEGLQPTPEHVAEADSLARVIRDEELRKVVAKAAALSLARAADDRSFW